MANASGVLLSLYRAQLVPTRVVAGQLPHAARLQPLLEPRHAEQFGDDSTTTGLGEVTLARSRVQETFKPLEAPSLPT